MRDHVAVRDQTQARIDHTRSIVIQSWIWLSSSGARTERHEQRLERTIDRLARSRLTLAEARRTLARR
jgi:hypothetical protein